MSRSTARSASLQWVASYHQYEADHYADYGSEWDASLSYAFLQRFTALAKFASYDADGYSTDADKIWLSLEYKYDWLRGPARRHLALCRAFCFVLWHPARRYDRNSRATG